MTSAKLETSSASLSESAAMTSAELETAAKKHQKRLTHLLQQNQYKDKNHPIYNFLFTYIYVNAKQLFRYSPGVGAVVQGVSLAGKTFL